MGASFRRGRRKLMAKVFTLTGPSYMPQAFIGGVFATRAEAHDERENGNGDQLQQDIVKEWTIGSDPRELGELESYVGRLEQGFNYLADKADPLDLKNAILVMTGKKPRVVKANKASKK
jgi:hypothetical protein